METKIHDKVRRTKICDGWIEADWPTPEGDIIYRLPDIGLSQIGVIVAYRIDLGDTRAKSIHWSGFKYAVSRSAINHQLRILEEHGFIKKSDTMKGRNTYWQRLKKIGVTGDSK